MNKKRLSGVVLAVAAGSMVLGCIDGFAETGTEHPWSYGVTFGWKDLEGNEAIQDSGNVSAHASYDYSERWTFEAVLQFFPSLHGNTRTDWATGEIVNRLEEKTGGPGTGVRDTSAFGISLECLFHLTRWKRVDPYFVVGG